MSIFILKRKTYSVNSLLEKAFSDGYYYFAQKEFAKLPWNAVKVNVGRRRNAAGNIIGGRKGFDYQTFTKEDLQKKIASLQGLNTKEMGTWERKGHRILLGRYQQALETVNSREAARAAKAARQATPAPRTGDILSQKGTINRGYGEKLSRKEQEARKNEILGVFNQRRASQGKAELEFAGKRRGMFGKKKTRQLVEKAPEQSQPKPQSQPTQQQPPAQQQPTTTTTTQKGQGNPTNTGNGGTTTQQGQGNTSTGTTTQQGEQQENKGWGWKKPALIGGGILAAGGGYYALTRNKDNK